MLPRFRKLIRLPCERMKTFFGFVFILIAFSAYSQGSSNGVRVVTSISGVECGYSYPFLTRAYGYHLEESHFNFGFSLGYEWGRRYPSGNSLMLVPSFVVNSINTTKHQFERRNETTDKIEYQNIITVESKNMSLIIPGIFELPFWKRFRLAAGPFFNIQLRGQEHYENYSYSLFHIPRLQKYSYVEGLESSIGFVTKLGIPIRSKENNEHLLSLQYVHTIEGNFSTGNAEKRFTLSFTSRNLIEKEVREKWDRSLTRKQSY